MRLSIIIVNYNVAHLLVQALESVDRAIQETAQKNWACEVIIVDNDSKDHSVELCEKLFPQFKLIANKENVGFSKANNQGIRIASGEFVLLLNPDTIVAEDTFVKVLAFVDQHPDCGGLGIRMIDGRGNFLPESKRGIPTPMVSLYKMTGLSKLFPKSKLFNEYHLGYLNEKENHAAPVLSGAFMLLRKEALDKVGLLDETFFMYGEDIDLSYRIVKGGYQNYYFADSSIIHYKGESTKKGSLNYVRIFYKAMLIFAEKHFKKSGGGGLYTLFINIGIYLRASLSLVARMLLGILPFVIDALMMFVGLLFIRNFYSVNFKGAASYYPIEYLTINVPIYIVLWLMSIYFSGGYDRPFNLRRLIRGVIVGTLIISAAYGFLPEELRFSRAMILLGAIWSVFLLPLWRLFFPTADGEFVSERRKIAIVGSWEESQRVRNILLDNEVIFDFVGYLNTKEENKAVDQKNYLGNFIDLKELVEIYQIEEIIFCSQSLSYKSIIEKMDSIGPQLRYKIAPSSGNYLIGSDSKNTAGDSYISEQNYKISQVGAKRNKRVFDIFSALIFILLFPLLAFFVKQPLSFLKNCLSVFFGRKTWIGFSSFKQDKLPKLKKSVITPIDALSEQQQASLENKGRLLKLYASDYSIYKEFGILRKAFRKLGKS